MRRPRSKWIVLCILAGGALAGLMAIMTDRQAALTGLAEYLVQSDRLEKADLIYVLAGDFFGSRVLTAAQLGAQGYAPQVLLSGGLYRSRYTGDMARDFAVEHGYPRALFRTVRLNAESTTDEVREMGPIFRRMGARRIILVTSNFHSRRAALAFRLFLPDLEFRVAASPDQDFDPHSWWRTERARHLLFSEYEKIAGTLLMRAAFANPAWLRRAHS